MNTYAYPGPAILPFHDNGIVDDRCYDYTFPEFSNMQFGNIDAPHQSPYTTFYGQNPETSFALPFVDLCLSRFDLTQSVFFLWPDSAVQQASACTDFNFLAVEQSSTSLQTGFQDSYQQMTEPSGSCPGQWTYGGDPSTTAYTALQMSDMMTSPICQYKQDMPTNASDLTDAYYWEAHEQQNSSYMFPLPCICSSASYPPAPTSFLDQYYPHSLQTTADLYLSDAIGHVSHPYMHSAYSTFGNTGRMHQMSSMPQAPRIPKQTSPLPNDSTTARFPLQEVCNNDVGPSSPVPTSKTKSHAIRSEKSPKATRSRTRKPAGRSRVRRKRRHLAQDENAFVGTLLQPSSPVTCQYDGCTQAFIDPADLVAHLRAPKDAIVPGHGFANHNGSEVLNCPWIGCTKRNIRKNSMCRHYTKHLVRRRCTIAGCPYSSEGERVDTMKTHFKAAHPSVKFTKKVGKRDRDPRHGLLMWQLRYYRLLGV